MSIDMLSRALAVMTQNIYDRAPAELEEAAESCSCMVKFKFEFAKLNWGKRDLLVIKDSISLLDNGLSLRLTVNSELSSLWDCEGCCLLLRATTTHPDLVKGLVLSLVVPF